MSILDYPDPYLSRFCTPEREERAFDAVDFYGTFDDDHRNKLARLQCYMLAALENQGSADDLFGVKYKAYQNQFNASLVQARAAQTPADGIALSVFSVPMERG